MLNPDIENEFSFRQRIVRQATFDFITKKKQNAPYDEVIINGAKKIYHGKFHIKFRGSLYRGVSRNGRQWQILVMIDS